MKKFLGFLKIFHLLIFLHVLVNIVYFYFGFDFNFIHSNIVIFIGALSNLFLIFIYQKTQLSDRSALIFLLIDILQLSILIYLGQYREKQ